MEETLELKKVKASRNAVFFEGVRDSLPISLGYIPVAITFALLSKSYGLPNHIIVLMSMLVFSATSQFIAVNLLTLATPYPEIILTTFIINAKNFLLSSALSQKIEPSTSKKLRSLISYCIGDEIFILATARKERHVDSAYFLGVNSILYIAYAAGTFVGAYFISDMSPAIATSLGITIYALFLSLLVPAVKKSRKALIISIISILASTALSYMPSISLSPGWVVIIAAVAAAGAGAVIFPVEVHEHE